jgi:hypothetical protein
MNHSTLPILISVFSLLLAAFSLGWNIYRDVVMKAKLRLNIICGEVHHPTFKNPEERISVSVTNHGPGKSRACMLVLRKVSWWRKVFRKIKTAILLHDFEDPLSGNLPQDLEVGDKVDLTFRFLENLFIKEDWNQIGITDPFGSTHWCKKKDYLQAKKSFLDQQSNQNKTCERNAEIAPLLRSSLT